MNKTIILLFLIGISFKLNSNNLNDQDSLKKVDINGTEKMPEPKEGIIAFVKYISSNIRYPEAVLSGEVSGSVFLKFIVEKDGSLTDFQVLRGISNCLECDKEALRVLTQYPNKWIPGYQDGKPARVFYTLPIKFRR